MWKTRTARTNSYPGGSKMSGQLGGFSHSKRLHKHWPSGVFLRDVSERFAQIKQSIKESSFLIHFNEIT